MGVDVSIMAVGDPYVELGATAVDDVDGDITPSIVIDSTAVNTAVVGSYPVTYNVMDAAGNMADQVTRMVDVIAGAILVVAEFPVIVGTDDVEERADGSVIRGSSDLEMVEDASIQTVGLRFQNVSIPPGSTVISAHVQFYSDETNSVFTSLDISGQAADDAPAFVVNAFEISSRDRTTASVHWEPAAWNEINVNGPAQQTPDLASVIDEVVKRAGWINGNALALIIEGAGKRVAESRNGRMGQEPVLHVVYTTP